MKDCRNCGEKLESNIENKDKFILVQFLTYGNTYTDNLTRIRKEVDDIKKEFGENSIYYQEFNEDQKNVDFRERLAVFSLGNILLLMQRYNKICSLIIEYLLVQDKNKIFGIYEHKKNEVSDRIRDHNGCPACANKVLFKGYNETFCRKIEKVLEWTDEMGKIIYTTYFE